MIDILGEAITEPEEIKNDMVSDIINRLTEAVTWGKFDYDALIEIRDNSEKWLIYYNRLGTTDVFRKSITTLIQECDIAISDIKYKMDSAEEIERQKQEDKT